ncbi:hypothetical protein K1719_003341 [Acacia pycnantha]|nr:hypothetical protein K1719_003341 [Acacia pycnantha]
MAGRQCSMIKDLDDSTEMWWIVVRFLRRWNSYHKDSPNQLYVICLLLIDQQGDKIHASVMNKSLFKQFEKESVEGQCYFIANLEVIPNGKDYKAANHQFKLLFNSTTYVKEETAEIPLSVFNFFPIIDILTQTVENHTMFMFGRPEVCSSFNATKIHLNGNFQEVAEFIASAKHLLSPTITSLTPTAGTQNSTSAAETILRNTPTIKVSNIPLQEVEAICYAFPREVDNLIDKKMLLKMKLNKYNKDHPNSSVSDATYIEATDLIDAFDAAATEVGQPSVICHDDEEEIILMRNCTAEDKGPSTAEPNIT